MQPDNQQEQAPATARGAPSGTRWMRMFGLNSLVGRHLAISALFVVIIIAVAWTAQSHVTGATRANTDNLAARVEVNRQLLQLSNALWEIETGFQSYMLVGEENTRATVTLEAEALNAATRHFSGLEWVASNPTVSKISRHLADQVDKLRHELAAVMEVRADPFKVFPAVPIMVLSLNPTHQEFLGATTIGLDEADQNKDDPSQRRIHQLFEDVRYTWSQRINAFRMLVTSRLGLYSISIESGMTAAIDDVEAFDAIVKKKLDQLAALDQNGQLTFLQSDALRDLFRLRLAWNEQYKQAKEIYVSRTWRRDVPAIRDTIGPLFSDVWRTLRDVEAELEYYAAGDVELALDVAGQTSNTLWMIALIGLLVTGAGAALFEFQMRRPLARVAAALKDESDGQSHAPLPRTNTAETSQLVSAFEQMQSQVRTRQARLEAVMRFAAEAIVTIDTTGRIEGFNPAAEKLFGHAGPEVVGRPIGQIIPAIDGVLRPRGAPGFAEFASEHLLGRLYQERGKSKDGEYIPISLRVSEMHVDDQRLFLAIIEDDRERHAMLEQLRAREQRLQSILDNTAEAIVTFDRDGLVESWNKAAEQLFGWTESEIRGAAICRIVALGPEADGARQFDPHTAIDKMVGRETETTGHRKTGESFPLALKLSRLEIDGQPKFTALIANISERKAMVENLRQLAERDGLTNLFNRTYFQTEFTRAVNDVKQGAIPTCALLYIDLDNFKFVNDTLGHAAGDRVIVEVATLLSRRVRKNDLVARLGGDEFVVLIYDTDAEHIIHIAESFRRHLAEYTLKHEGQIVDLGCSVGVAVIDATIASENDAMAQADFACHLAKRQGRNRVHVFTSADQKDVHTMSLDMGWSRRIKDAIENDGFVLMCHPIVQTTTRRVVDYEILVRMRAADGSLIMPSGFLPTAERFGLMVYVDQWVVRHAIELLGRVHKRDPEVSFSINLSAQTLAPPIAQLIAETIARHRVNPSRLTFEITETTAIAEMDAAVAVLTQLHEIGCSTALDDFGSGMASFAYLRELPVTRVKIDGRFVRNLSDSAVDGVMIQAMNEIAHALGRETIAEFVETEEQHSLLADLGVDFCQGYFFSKPFPAETLEANHWTLDSNVVNAGERFRSKG
jgi:diguanylate cyclase (GGDEF)-like protein/PAS domain S-box-containing protein